MCVCFWGNIATVHILKTVLHCNPHTWTCTQREKISRQGKSEEEREGGREGKWERERARVRTRERESGQALERERNRQRERQTERERDRSGG